jgi:dissimilatory sulfite reductase (desulfoviridin) alpha/beta subunit
VKKRNQDGIVSQERYLRLVEKTRLFGTSQGDVYEIKICRNSCPMILSDLSRFQDRILDILEKHDFESWVRRNVKNYFLAHNRFKISIAGCPNACTEPQIKDIGVILRAKPFYNGDCNQCRLCEKTCRENAIVISDYPEFDYGRCVACGACERVCKQNAITTEKYFDVYIGGKLGRHPQFALYVESFKDEREVLRIIEAIVGLVKEYNKTRIGEFVNEENIGKIRNCILNEVK